MITGELLSYIERNLKRGVLKTDLQVKLLEIGWKKSDIDEAFSIVSKKIGDEVIGKIVPPAKKTEKPAVSNVPKKQSVVSMPKKVSTPQKEIKKPKESEIKIYEDKPSVLSGLFKALILILLFLATLAGVFYFYVKYLN